MAFTSTIQFTDVAKDADNTVRSVSIDPDSVVSIRETADGARIKLVGGAWHEVAGAFADIRASIDAAKIGNADYRRQLAPSA